MSNTAFGVRNVTSTSGTVTGTSPADMRAIIAALMPTTGIVTGLTVSRESNSLCYWVDSGVAVCSKGAGYGKVLAAWSGGSTPAVSANTAGNPRVDAIWIDAHDPDQGDKDNLVTLGVTEGTAAVSPTAPAIPTYATLLGHMTLPAGATSTAQAVRNDVGQRAVPVSGSMGVLLNAVNTETKVGGSVGWKEVASGFVSLPTKRLVRIDVTTCMKGKVPNVGTDTDGSCHVRVLVDGSYDKGMGYERQLRSSVTADSQYMVTTLDAGQHSVELQVEDGTSGWQGAYGQPNGSSSVRLVGQVICVTDLGAA
ncbi:MAG: hypothetical protein ACI360_08605 [Atopobiaceae bacterium]